MTQHLPRWVAILAGLAGAAASAAPPAEAVRLRESFPAGYTFHVHSRTTLSGTLTPPAEKDKPATPLTVSGTGDLEYDERIVDVTDGQARKTLRVYKRLDFRRKVGDRPQEAALRQEVRRLVILRHKHTEVPFSPDGPLLWGEIDLVRTDVFTPALVGLLPDKPVKPGERWHATRSAVEELTDMDIDDGALTCTFDDFATLNQRRHALLKLSGTVKGVNEDGPGRQQLEGKAYFDLESNHLAYLSFKGVHTLLDAKGNAVGRVEGQFTLTRQPHPRCAELRDEVVRGLKLEPDAENTLLLYDNPDIGVRLLYPRRWRVAGLRGRQLTLDEPGGGGLLLTVEAPERTPTAAAFLAESQAFLRDQKMKLFKVDLPTRLRAAPSELTQFALEAEDGGQRVWLDYFVLKQARAGGTIAARLPPKDLDATRKDVARIARSVTLTRAPEEPRPMKKP